MGRSNQPPLLFYRRSVKEQLTYPEALEQLRAAYEHEKIVLTAHISTLEVTVGQQSIQVKRLEEQVKTLQQIKTLIQETNDG